MKPSLGIEIGERYLKLVAARPAAAKQGGWLEFGAYPISNFQDGEISKIISSFLQKTKFKARSAAICIPRNMLTVKTLQLPTRDSKESEQMIELHLGRLVPYKKEEIIFGHQFLGTNATGYGTEMLAIVRRDTVRRQCNIVEAAGLSVDKMYLSSHGAWQWVMDNFHTEMEEKDLYLLLDVDYSFVDLVIFSSKALLFSRTIAIDPAKEGLNTYDLAKLINEIKQSLIIFYNEAMHKKPAGIFIAGSSVITGLRAKIENEFNLPVKEVPSPVSKYSPSSGGANLPKDISLSAVSELVLEDNPNRIAFVLPEVQIQRSLKEKTKELLILGTLLIYFFTAVMAFFVLKLGVKQAYLNKLTRESAVIEENVGVMIGQARKIEFIKDFLYIRKEPLALLQELQKLTPVKIAINYISMDVSYNMTLRGEGEQLSDVFAFTTVLEKSDYFENVATKRTRTKRVKDKEVTEFEITLNSSIKK